MCLGPLDQLRLSALPRGWAPLLPASPLSFAQYRVDCTLHTKDVKPYHLPRSGAFCLLPFQLCLDWASRTTGRILPRTELDSSQEGTSLPALAVAPLSPQLEGHPTWSLWSHGHIPVHPRPPPAAQCTREMQATNRHSKKALHPH